MCPAVKKQLLNLYAAFGFTPTKAIIVPGYIPIPPEGGGGGGGSDTPEDIEEAVRNTTITITDPDGSEETVTVEQMAAMLINVIADMQAAKKKYLTGHIVDEDSDEQPDEETIYLKTDVAPAE